MQVCIILPYVTIRVTVNLLNLSDYTGGLPGVGAQRPHQRNKP